MAIVKEAVFPDVYAHVRGTPQDPDLEHDGTEPPGYGIFWRERRGKSAARTTDTATAMPAAPGKHRYRRKRG